MQEGTMSTEKPEVRSNTCPSCGAQLVVEGELLRCAEHGAFFIYGRHLLVRVPRQGASEAPLMPWQTMAK
jgi:hypothetical protein